MVFRALYVHIPFCLAKCQYCDFVSFRADDKLSALPQYKDLLLREADFWTDEQMAAIETVYIGGGTPTVLDVDDLAELISYLKQRCRLADEAEITVECNPATVDAAALYRLRQSGANRLSVGVQNFHDAVLRSMGRMHTVSDAMRIIEDARAAGFTNISIDLMSGLPGQTVDDWLWQLNTATDLQPQHISLYGLSLAEDSAWGKAAAGGLLSLPSEEECAMMMAAGHDFLLEAGFEHYEIANFARPGYYSRHNMAYWQRLDYLPLGVAAAGMCGNRRWLNHQDLALYERSVLAGQKPVGEEEFLTSEQVISEAVFLGLRLLDGIDLRQFSALYGVDLEEKFAASITKMRQMQLLELGEDCLRLSAKGRLLANEVFMAFV